MGSSNPVSLAPVPDTFDVGLTPASINIAASGTIVPAVAGKRIWVFGYHMVAAASVTATWQDVSAGATVGLTGPMTMANGTPFVLPYQQYPWYSVASGDALVLALGGAVQVSGRLLYVQG